jgi:hypothetical protein
MEAAFHADEITARLELGVLSTQSVRHHPSDHTH